MKFKAADVLIHTELFLTPEFNDIDPMNVVWHGHYWRYFEQARRLLLQKIGYGYAEMSASGYSWPVVDARIKYIKPILFGQEVVIGAYLTEYEHRMKINFEVRDRHNQALLCRAYSTHLAVNMATQEVAFVTPKCWQDQVVPQQEVK